MFLCAVRIGIPPLYSGGNGGSKGVARSDWRECKMIRRFGEAYLIDKTYRLRPGAYAILTDGDRVLLTYQEEPHSEFQLPGGGIDPGESPIPALHREVFEETGYSFGVPRRLGAYRRFGYMPDYDMWAEKICHIYVARVGLRYGAPSEAGHTAHWMTFSEAADCLANEGDRHFLTEANY
jgi:8-oxo-dGTP diphosphatase